VLRPGHSWAESTALSIIWTGRLRLDGRSILWNIHAKARGFDYRHHWSRLAQPVDVLRLSDMGWKRLRYGKGWESVCAFLTDAAREAAPVPTQAESKAVRPR